MNYDLVDKALVALRDHLTRMFCTLPILFDSTYCTVCTVIIWELQIDTWSRRLLILFEENCVRPRSLARRVNDIWSRLTFSAFHRKFYRLLTRTFPDKIVFCKTWGFSGNWNGYWKADHDWRFIQSILNIFRRQNGFDPIFWDVGQQCRTYYNTNKFF